MKKLIFIIQLICLTFSLDYANAKKAPANFYDLPKVVAVANRPYYTKHDLTFDAGWLPFDAFNKGFSIGVDYTYYFKDYLAWEVVDFNYVISSPTGLKSQLENSGIDLVGENLDGVLDYMNMYVTTGVVYTPFYNKSLAFNETVVHGNTSLIAGVGLANFDATGAKFMVTAGVSLRFFTQANRSWKFNFRNNVHFEDAIGAVYTMQLGVGYSMELSDPPSKKN